MNLGFLSYQKNIIYEEEDITNNIKNPPNLSSTKTAIYMWNRTWGGNDYDDCYNIVKDGSNNLYLVGRTYSFGNGNGDICLIKFNESGEQQWNLTWGDSFGDGAYAVELDSSENIYITGYTSNSDICLLKYNKSGIEQWNRSWGGTGTELSRSITLDSSGNIYVAGSTTSFGEGNYDVCLIKYNNSGFQLWNRTWGGSNIDFGYGVAIDSMENIYVIGYTFSYGAGDSDICLIKYNNSGDQIWNKTWGTNSFEYGYGIEIDTLDNIYIAGSKTNEFCLIKYTDSGFQLWNRTWGLGSEDKCCAIKIDSLQEIYVTGFFHSEYGFDIYLAEFNSSGQIKWNVTWKRTGYWLEWAYDLELDSYDNIYLAGSLETTNGGPTDICLIKYSIDNDGDGLSNWQESNVYYTDPNDSDTEDDGMPDGWEVDNNLNPHIDDSGGDLDLDSLSNIDEYTNSTNPNDSDTEDDGMPDGWEVINNLNPLIDDSNGDPDNDTLSNLNEYTNSTDPNDSDSEDDGMPDGWEVDNNLNPLIDDSNGDPDSDTLSNLNEYTNSTDPNDSDTEDDGMPDGWEVDNNLNPLIDDSNGDPDNDTLSNLNEYTNSTDPNDSDTEDDGMPDGWEVDNNLNPLIDDSNGDPDSDTLSNLNEYTNSTDPNDSDSDDDNLTDGEEINISLTDPNDPDTDNDNIPDGWEVLNSLNPLLDDSGLDPDSDNLINFYEFANNTDPNDSDTDNDGLDDGAEISGNDNQYNGYPTDPNDPDTDDDGLSDGIECSGIMNQYDGVPTDPNNSDSDGDGLNDSAECNGSENQYDGAPTDPNNSDSDEDGLSDSQENSFSTDPNSSDTDNDGFSDGEEIANGFNPNDPLSNPTMNLIIISSVIIVITIVSITILLTYRNIKRKRIKQLQKERIEIRKREEVKLKQLEREKQEFLVKLKNKIPYIENLIADKNYIKAIEELESMKPTAYTYNFGEIKGWLENKLIFCKIALVKTTILDLSTKFDRLELAEIVEKSGVKDDQMIQNIINEMIENEEIHAEYFSSSKALMFDQQANIDEIDKLMKTYREWEEEEFRKKI